MRQFIFLVVGLCIFMFSNCLLSSSAGGGSANEEDSADDDISECEDNYAPELKSIHYFIGSDEKFPPLVMTTTEFENFYIGLAYSDEDCNLEGGSLFLVLEEEKPIESQLEGKLGCSSEQVGKLYRIKLIEVIGDLTSGEYNCKIWWTDVCKDKSNEIEFSFTIQ